jgi:hypothetical protein
VSSQQCNWGRENTNRFFLFSEMENCHACTYQASEQMFDSRNLLKCKQLFSLTHDILKNLWNAKVNDPFISPMLRHEFIKLLILFIQNFVRSRVSSELISKNFNDNKTKKIISMWFKAPSCNFHCLALKNSMIFPYWHNKFSEKLTIVHLPRVNAHDMTRCKKKLCNINLAFVQITLLHFQFHSSWPEWDE